MRALLALAWTALAIGQPSSVDWERRVVRCGGAGAPTLREAAGAVPVTRVGAESAARREAHRACLAALRGVAIETGSTVGQALDRDPRLAAALESALKRVRKASEPRFFSDGGVELRLEIPLDGEISELVLPPASSGAARGDDLGPRPNDLTGLVVDATAHPVAYALAPRILDEAGLEVYGPSALTARARRGGTATYASDVAAARRASAERLGTAPRVVRAIASRGADVVVSAADAGALRGAACLREGRVVIVTPAPGAAHGGDGP